MYPVKTLLDKKFSASDIQIKLLSNARWSANSVYDEQVIKVWKEKERLATEDKVKIWDGTYYRVTNVSEIEETGQLILRLGTIPYRYIATASNLKDLFKENDLEPLFHLSTAAIIRTSEGEYIFGKRSRNGTIDLIGGGVQQDELEVLSGTDLERNLLKEIIEEAGIEQIHIQSIHGIGVVQSITSNIIIISLVQLKLSQVETNEVFKRRQEDEMSELIYVSENEVKPFLKGMTSYRPLIAGLL